MVEGNESRYLSWADILFVLEVFPIFVASVFQLQNQYGLN